MIKEKTFDKTEPQSLLFDFPIVLWSLILGYADINWNHKEFDSSHSDIFWVIKNKFLPLISNAESSKNYSELQELITNDSTLAATLTFDTSSYSQQREKLQQFYYTYILLLGDALKQKRISKHSCPKVVLLSTELKQVKDLLSQNKNKTKNLPIKNFFDDTSAKQRFLCFIDKIVIGIADGAKLKLNANQLLPRQFIESLAKQTDHKDPIKVARQISINFLQITTPPLLTLKRRGIFSNIHYCQLHDPSLKYLDGFIKQVNEAKSSRLYSSKGFILAIIFLFTASIFILIKFTNAPPLPFLTGFIGLFLSLYIAISSTEQNIVEPWVKENADLFPDSKQDSSQRLEPGVRMEPQWEISLSVHRYSLYKEVQQRLGLQEKKSSHSSVTNRL